MSVLLWLTAFMLDLKLGDPHHWPHPIHWIGWLISQTEKVIRSLCHTEFSLKLGGAALWIVVVGASWLVSFWLLRLAFGIQFWLGCIVEVWMIYTTLATRSLSDAAHLVYRALKKEDLAESREKLSWIVGRNTCQLEPHQIAQATTETVAENTVDGVISPLFFLMLGGAPLAMAYKAVNTLDSMVGYKTPKFQAIGMFSARMDDVANWFPARLSWLLLVLAACWLKLNYRQALHIGWRDRYQHKSPNSGWPEATVAGALGIRLGGSSIYFEQRIEKPWIGEARREITLEDISTTTQLMMTASVIALSLFALLQSLFNVMI